MHQVPGIVKHAYKPLLKRAKAYAPEAIYVERPDASDTLSLSLAYTKFLHQADSLRKVWQIDPEQLSQAQGKPLHAMDREDFKLLNRHYILQLDYANAAY